MDARDGLTRPRRSRRSPDQKPWKGDSPWKAGSAVAAPAAPASSSGVPLSGDSDGEGRAAEAHALVGQRDEEVSLRQPLARL